jgi:hypothetical protein
MAVTNGWGQAAKNNTNGFGKLATNNIGAGSIYENSYSGDTALIGTSAAFLYSKSSFNQGEADPTPTITGTAGGSFNADAGVVFVDTGSFNSSTGQIDLSATSIGSHIITYTVNGVQSGQSVGVESPPYSSTSSFTFDGVNDYFDLGTSILPRFSSTGNGNTEPWSVSLWANFTTGSEQPLIQFPYGVSSNTWYLFHNTKISFGHRDSSALCTETNSTAINSNQWNHIVVAFDGVDITNISSFKLYINAVNIPISIRNHFGRNNTNAINIGRGFTSIYYDGNLDEVSIWDSALSSDAITEIYNSGAPNDLTSLTNASSSNLKAWYKMGE